MSLLWATKIGPSLFCIETFHVQCFSKSNSSWSTLLGALRQVHFQTSVWSTIVTLDHLYFTSDVFQVILLYMVRVWDWWQSAKSVFLLSAINQAKFTKIHASQATKSPCSKDCAVDLKDGCKLREQGLSIVLAQNLEKAHLSKTMKSPSFPVESYELWVYFEQQKSVRVCSA